MGGWHNASPPTQEGATQMNSVASNPPQSACGSDCDANDDEAGQVSIPELCVPLTTFTLSLLHQYSALSDILNDAIFMS